MLASVSTFVKSPSRKLTSTSLFFAFAVAKSYGFCYNRMTKPLVGCPLVSSKLSYYTISGVCCLLFFHHFKIIYMKTSNFITFLLIPIFFCIYGTKISYYKCIIWYSVLHPQHQKPFRPAFRFLQLVSGRVKKIIPRRRTAKNGRNHRRPKTGKKLDNRKKRCYTTRNFIPKAMTKTAGAVLLKESRGS